MIGSSQDGFVSFDDYGHWPGCRKAVDEFFEVRQLAHKLVKVDYTARWFQKEMTKRYLNLGCGTRF